MYHYINDARQPWYKNSKDLIAIFLSTMALVVSIIGLNKSNTAQVNATSAKTQAEASVQGANEIINENNKKTLIEAAPEESFFIYTSTFFSGQKQKA